GPEIWEEAAGRVTHFVAGLGTTGTIVGISRFLRERNPRVEVIAVEPDQEMHGLEGLKHLPSSVVPEGYDPRAHDLLLRLAPESAYAVCEEVRRRHGLRIGHSAG